jgi:hypothetical protein
MTHLQLSSDLSTIRLSQFPTRNAFAEAVLVQQYEQAELCAGMYVMFSVVQS